MNLDQRLRSSWIRQLLRPTATSYSWAMRSWGDPPGELSLNSTTLAA